LCHPLALEFRKGKKEMKASELIKRLNELTEKYGDHEVTIFQDEAEQAGDLFSLSVGMDENDKPFAFTLVGN
jgi:hypothetical protein